MAKTNMAAIMKLAKEIEKKEGEGSIFSLGSNNSNLRMPRWSTGIEDLDNIIGGGMPEGRIIEIYGVESSGKTSLGYHLCSMHDICLDIPIEGTFDYERAKVFGNRKKQMLIYSKAKYGEQAFNRMIQYAETGIPLILLDSVPSMQPKEDVDKIKKAVRNNQDTTDLRIGGIARLMTNYLPILEEVIEQTGTTIVFINQCRDNMNAMLFGDKDTTPGGRKLRHACSIRMKVARKEWIQLPNKNPSITSVNEKVGLIMKIKIQKSKVSNPMGECEIPMFFDRGFVSFDDIQDVRKELLKQRAEQFGKRVPKGDDW